jgi:hypothetical protein
LERISKVWLVAKMIQNLYEFILIEKGFGDCLQDGPRKIQDRNVPLIGQRTADVAGYKNNGMVAESSEKSNKSVGSQSPALTPALLAHMLAALKSGTSPSSAESSDSLKDSLDPNSGNRHQQPSHLTGITRGEIYNSYLVFDTQNALPVSQQFMEEPRIDPFTAQATANMHISQEVPQQTPIGHNPETYAPPQSEPRSKLSIQGLETPRDEGFIQNAIERSQYFPSEIGELQHSYPENEAGFYTTGSYYASINTPTNQPPANTGPNVLDWSVDFLHTWCRF